MLLLFYCAVAIIVIQLMLPFLTVVAERLSGKETLPPITTPAEPLHYACIITAYRNAAIARPLVQSLLKQSYPHLHIYWVADECPQEFEPGITHAQLTFLRPDPPLRLKAKSIIYATERLVKRPDYIAIFDADNLAHPEFLAEINRYATAGYRSIQGQRTAKNTDQSFAAADALGEIYKNYIERYAPYRLGGSAVISGSGMAVATDLYLDYLNSSDIQQGKEQWKKMLQEDKILQNVLLRRNERIVYAWNAICYDEKVQSGDAVQTQRSRWLFSYFQNLPNTLGLLGQGLIKGRWNQFFFGLVTLSLPMFIQLAVAALLFLIGLLLVAPWASFGLAMAVVIFAGTVLWTLKLSDAPAQVWQALAKMPAFVGRQAMALIKMGNPNKNFKHTEHTKVVTVEELLDQAKPPKETAE
jgi:cellulose synthase/poly-beta-1,6-N-acetylglucosamine synthase-like glycosyltransferase